MSNATETGSSGMRRLLISLACFMFLIFLSGSASATTYISSCGTLSTQGETYILSNDISTSGSCITIGADGITLDGNWRTITGTRRETGVYLSGRTGVTIKNLIVKNFDSGIYLESFSSSTLTNNTVNSNNYGIHLGSSSNNTLTNNTANSNSYYGIDLYSSSNNTLTNNTASSNTHGIILYSSSNNNTLTNNTASSNGRGIYLYNSSNNTLTSNTANSNNYGIHLISSSNNTLTNNTANSNTNYGIWLYSSSNNTLTSNTASSNTNYGIHLVSSSNYNTLTSNTASSNSYGIHLISSSNNNTLTNNTASSNGGTGIYLESSSSNTIYNNYFNNSNNFNFGGTIYGNIWNTVQQAGTNIIGGPYLGGNYWANPSGTGFSQTCTDGNGDGICDSSYTLASGNVDYLPLTVPGILIPTTNSTICGVKFNDLNGNGVKDVNETGLANWTIQIKYVNGTVAATATTNATGGYCVTLPAGNYTASEVLQAGWNQTSPSAPGTYTLNLTAGQTVQNISFGNLLSILTPAQATQNLTTQVQNLGPPSGPLNQGQVNALTVKLNAALNSLNAGNTVAACNQLNAFINQVNALTQPPANKPLTPTQGNALIAQAQAVMTSIGC